MCPLSFWGFPTRGSGRKQAVRTKGEYLFLHHENKMGTRGQAQGIQIIRCKHYQPVE